MDTTCLYNQLLAGYLGGSHSGVWDTDNYVPLLCVMSVILVCDNAAIKRCPAQYRKKKKMSDVIRTIVVTVQHRLNHMPT